MTVKSRVLLLLDWGQSGDLASRRLATLEGWVASGALKVPEAVTEGLEGLPAALVGLLHGENRGKRIVKVA